MEKFFKHPWVVVIVITLITVFFASQLRKAEIDNDMNGFLPNDNKVRIYSEHINDLYGEEVIMFVGLERKYGTVFDQAFLARIRDFTDFVEQIPIVKESISILSMPYITADDTSIFITDLVDEDFTGTPDEIAELKRRLASWDLYQGSTVSANFTATQIIVSLSVSIENLQKPEIVADIYEIRLAAERIFSDLATVYLTGQPVMLSTMNVSMRTDLRVLLPIVLFVLLTVLFFSFRRLTYVVLPLLTVIIAVIWAIGVVPLFGFKLSILSVILPVILIAVGNAYGIHVISHYIDDTRHKILSKDEHRALVFAVLRKLFKPLVLAALTTMAGFVSFCFTWLAPIRDFGYFSTFGIAVALLITVTFIPALLLIRGPQKEKAVKQKTVRNNVQFNTALGNILIAVSNQKAVILTLTVAVLIFSVYGLSKLNVDGTIVENFRRDSDVSRSDRFIREYFGGSTQITLSIEADSTEALLNPDVLTAIDNLAVYLKEQVPHIGRVAGFTDMIKRMNQLFNVDEPPEGVTRPHIADTLQDNTSDEFGFGDFGNFGDFSEEETYTLGVSGMETGHPRTAPALPNSEITFSMLDSAIGKHTNMTANELVWELQRQTNYEGRAYYEIPSDPARYGKRNKEELALLITDYLVLVGGDTGTNNANDPLEPTAIRSSIQIKSQWQKDIDAVVAEIYDYVAANFPKNVNVIIGGSAMVQGELTSLVLKSQILSIFITILGVCVIIALANRSIMAGLFAAVPISLAILCNFGIMGFAGITLNMGTALISSLAAAISIDYTIHFMEILMFEYKEGGAYLHRTFASCGKAILINAVSVGSGFAVLLLSQFRMLASLGGLVALSMIITAVISLTFMPVMFESVKPKFAYGKSARCAEQRA